MIDFRALWAVLIQEIDAETFTRWQYCRVQRHQILNVSKRNNHTHVASARAALAEPEGKAPTDQLYVLFSSLECKLGYHMAEWKNARRLAAIYGNAGDELNQAHCDKVVRLLREHLEAHGKA